MNRALNDISRFPYEVQNLKIKKKMGENETSTKEYRERGKEMEEIPLEEGKIRACFGEKLKY